MNVNDLKKGSVKEKRTDGTTHLIEFTPDLAVRILSENRHSRPRKPTPSTIDFQTRILTRGEYSLKHARRNPIMFDSKGALRNGTHRMHAIVRSGTSVTLPVEFDCSEEDVATIDTGTRRRSVSDQLRMQYPEVKDPGRVSSAASIVQMIVEKKTQRPIMLPSETIEIYDKYQEGMDYINKTLRPLQGINRSAVRGSLSVSWKKYPKETKEFVDKLATGAGLEIGEPALLLRDYIRTGRRSGTARIEDKKLTFMTLSACKKHIEGKKQNRLRSPKDKDKEAQNELINFFL